MLTFRPQKFTALGTDRLSTLFEEVNLAQSICSEELVDANILERLKLEIGPPKVDRQRKVLLLCGAYLEEQIAFSAQHMLVTGYEVYMLRDLIVSRKPDLAHIHDQHLFHAGAVITTLQQLVYE